MQPPASGTVRGPVEQSGVEGGSITFPELSLRMPSLRLPGFSKTRQNARMETDQQMAPFVESPAAPAAAMPMQQAPMMAAPPQQMMAVQQAPQMMMMQMPASQMMMAPVQMVPPQQQYVPQQQFVPQPPAAPQPPPEEPPLQQRRDPSCDARNMQSVATAEEKIRQLELVEQQLKQRMDELRRQLQQIQTSDRPPTPTPDLGARRIPQPGRQPALQPVSQPIMQPALRPAQLRPQQYQERPAAYATEPQPIREPAPQYIREPQAATATITGFRQR